MKRLSAEDPRWIGSYRLLARLGEGGMGRVYLARSRRGRTVAVKVVQSELARQPDFRRRFDQEITAARRVGMGSAEGGGAEWTAPVLDADTDAETPWFATGYIAGPSLAEVVEEGYGPLPQHSVTALACGLVGALRAIHGAGIVHRDLKPSNILITIDGPRVIDFGIARALDGAVQSGGGLTRTGALVGSPGFMSPEQVRGLPVTPSSDIFCLGTVLAYAATGRLPFGTSDSGLHALMFRIAEEEPELDGLSGLLYEVVAACLAKDPQARPELDELASRLEANTPSQSGTWLPGEVLAQLGRHAVSLLDSEDPEGDEPQQAAGETGAGAGSAAGYGSGAGSGPGSGSGYRSGSGSGSGYDSGAGAWLGAGAVGGMGAGLGGGMGAGVPVGAGASAGTPPPSPYMAQNGVYGPPAWQPGTPQSGYVAYQGQPQGLGTPPPHAGTPPPANRLRRPARSPRTLGRVMMLLLGLTLAWEVARLILYFQIDHALGDTPSFAFDTSLGNEMTGYTSFKAGTLVLRVVGTPLIVGTIAMWLAWFWRVRVNAESFTVGRPLRYGPGMALGCWFIPLLNFFVPKQIMNDIWAVSSTSPAQWYGYGPAPRVRRGLVNAWWWLWLCYFLISAISNTNSWYTAYSLSGARDSVTIVQFTGVFGILAMIVALRLVHRLNSAQESRMAETQP